MAKIAERDENHAKCDTCKKFKEHINSGVITSSGKLVFVADKGTPWKIVGRVKTCPDCVSDQEILKELLKHDGKPRICRDDNYRVLPVRRHMFCEFCRPTLNNTEVDEDYLYNELGE